MLRKLALAVVCLALFANSGVSARYDDANDTAVFSSDDPLTETNHTSDFTDDNSTQAARVNEISHPGVCFTVSRRGSSTMTSQGDFGRLVSVSLGQQEGCGEPSGQGMKVRVHGAGPGTFTLVLGFVPECGDKFEKVVEVGTFKMPGRDFETRVQSVSPRLRSVEGQRVVLKDPGTAKVLACGVLSVNKY